MTIIDDEIKRDCERHMELGNHCFQIAPIDMIAILGRLEAAERDRDEFHRGLMIIEGLPVQEQDNLLSANMRKIAEDILDEYNKRNADNG